MNPSSSTIVAVSSTTRSSAINDSFLTVVDAMDMTLAFPTLFGLWVVVGTGLCPCWESEVTLNVVSESLNTFP